MAYSRCMDKAAYQFGVRLALGQFFKKAIYVSPPETPATSTMQSNVSPSTPPNPSGLRNMTDVDDTNATSRQYDYLPTQLNSTDQVTPATTHNRGSVTS